MTPVQGSRRSANIVETPDPIRQRPVLGNLARVDAMASLLDGPRARGAFLLRVELDPPWAMRIEDGAPLSLVVLTRGAAWLAGPSWLRSG
jgi:hypothetical protein